MKLYGTHTSPYVRHCRIALAEEKLDYDFILTDPAKSAEISPTKKVPFMVDGDLVLSDSTSILKYTREKAGKAYLSDIRDFDLFCFATTLLESAVNVFYLERAGVDVNDNTYIQRQQARIQQSLEMLDKNTYPVDISGNDALIRIACTLSWGLFRQRFSVDAYENLQALLSNANEYPFFADTAPFD